MARWTELTDANARAAMAAYFAKVDRALAPLSRTEAEELKAELEAHALDAFAEASDVNAALAQLGDPDEFLDDLVADRMRAACRGEPSDPATCWRRWRGALALGSQGSRSQRSLGLATRLPRWRWCSCVEAFAPQGRRRLSA